MQHYLASNVFVLNLFLKCMQAKKEEGGGDFKLIFLGFGHTKI